MPPTSPLPSRRGGAGRDRPGDLLGPASSISTLGPGWAGLVGLSGALVVYGSFADMGWQVNVLFLALVGLTLFGPDSLLCGAAAQDAGGPHAAATATGFVNGLGSIGAILEGVTVPMISGRHGWDALFPVLVAMALLASLVLLPTLKRVRPPRG